MGRYGKGLNLDISLDDKSYDLYITSYELLLLHMVNFIEYIGHMYHELVAHTLCSFN